MSFDDFWSKIPREMKKGKIYARKCYSKGRKNGMPDDDVLLKALDNQRREKEFLRSRNKFCPSWKNAATWLNQGCWDDVCILRTEPAKPKKEQNRIHLLSQAREIYDLNKEQFYYYCDKNRLTDEEIDMVINSSERDLSKLSVMKSM